MLTVVVALAFEAVITAVLHELVEEPVWKGAGAALLACTAAFFLYERRASRERSDAVAEANRRAAESERQLAEARKSVETRNDGLEVLHKAAEAIRHAVIESSNGGHYSRETFRDHVRTLLETGLREYLRDRLGDDVDYAVTIKWIKSSHLVSVFRDSKQTPPRSDSGPELLGENYFYKRLSDGAHLQNSLRCLVVHDTQATEIPATLRVRSSTHGYRSCLAVPLNLPIPSDKGLQGFGLVGFLSVDAPKTRKFDAFFDKVDPARELGCEGQNHSPKNDLHLLYGLADTVAAIYLLTQ